MAYIGRPLQVANLAVQSGTGDGSDTTPIATLDYATTTNGIAVYLDGVRQLAGTDFNVTAQTTLTFTTAPANGVGVDVYFLGLELSLPTPADDTVTGAKIVDDAIDSEHYTDGSIDTAHIADDQITLAKMAPGTDGNIISYDASGNPVAIATGSDGQVLTSTGAGSPPAFEAAPGVTDIKFLACLTSDQSNVTGDGTAWLTSSTTAWTEKYDTGSGFSNGTFTAPETGKYLIFFQMYISGIASNHTENNFYINTSNRNYSIGHENFANIYVTANVSYNLGPYMVVADMDAGDTATGYLAAYNGSKTIDMEGNGDSNSTSTYFGGALLA